LHRKGTVIKREAVKDGQSLEFKNQLVNIGIHVQPTISIETLDEEKKSSEPSLITETDANVSDEELDAIEKYMGTIETEGDEEFSALINSKNGNKRPLG
jgi:uncharacterized protein (DUF927 family)